LVDFSLIKETLINKLNFKSNLPNAKVRLFSNYYKKIITLFRSLSSVLDVRERLKTSDDDGTTTESPQNVEQVIFVVTVLKSASAIVTILL